MLLLTLKKALVCDSELKANEARNTTYRTYWNSRPRRRPGWWRGGVRRRAKTTPQDPFSQFENLQNLQSDKHNNMFNVAANLKRVNTHENTNWRLVSAEDWTTAELVCLQCLFLVVTVVLLLHSSLAYMIDHIVAQVCALFVSSSSPCLMRMLSGSFRPLHLPHFPSLHHLYLPALPSAFHLPLPWCRFTHQRRRRMRIKHQFKIRDASPDRQPKIQSSSVEETLQRIMGQTNNDCRFRIFILTTSSHPTFQLWYSWIAVFQRKQGQRHWEIDRSRGRRMHFQEDPLGNRCKVSWKLSGYVCSKVDRTEVYSRALFNERSMQLGLSTGVAPELETGCNLETKPRSDKRSSELRIARPKVMIASPPCPLIL